MRPSSLQPRTGETAALSTGGVVSKKKVLSWAMWDWGTQPFHTVIVTFVFAVYVTSDSFGSENTTSLALGVSTALAGLFIALLAPVLGQNSDRHGTTVRNWRWMTWLLAAVAASLFFIEPDPAFLWPGLILLGIGNVVAAIAEVNYNAAMDDIATAENVGKVSGFGWGMGYLGGIVSLLLLNFLFIAPDVGLFGVTNENGMDIRVSMVVCAAWIVLFTIPTWLNLRDRPGRQKAPRIGVVDSYKALWQSVKRIWRTSRDSMKFLLASALFRDGLSGVFTFGAVLAARTFEFTDAEVIMFGAAANVVAGLATIAIGTLDDKLGPKRVILFSLAAIVALGIAIFALHDAGKTVFWVFGMLMVIFVGPAQSASRSFLARIIPEGKSGEIFGLYATTGRAVSFLSPAMFALFVLIGSWVTGSDQTQYWGIIGIVLVLLAGLLLMTRVKDRPAVIDAG